MKTLPQQLWGIFFGCTSVATPATLGYPSNSGVVGKTSLTGSLYLSLGLSLTLTHSHTRASTHSLTHNHSTSLSFTLIHTNKNDRGKLPFLQTSRFPLMNGSTSSAFTLTKMIGENYLFLQTSRLPLMNESTTSGCEF